MSATITALVQSIKEYLDKGDNAKTRSEQHFIAAGKLLKELKERKPIHPEWGTYVKGKFNISKTWANDLIAMADGRTTIEEARERTRNNMKRVREERPDNRPARAGRLSEPDDDGRLPRARPRASDPVQEDCGEECANDEERWQRSLSSLAGDAISLEAFWTREFGPKWKSFEIPSSLVTLARQAAKSWTDLAAKLANK